MSSASSCQQSPPSALIVPLQPDITQCPPQCQNGASCQPSSGKCDCRPGWRGIYCDTPCPAGTWGQDCARECHCTNNGVCDHGKHTVSRLQVKEIFLTSLDLSRLSGEEVFRLNDWSLPCSVSGQCVCPAGFKGQHCEKVCEKKKFGIGCAYSCDCDPLHSEGCDHITGKCICRPGWGGELTTAGQSRLLIICVLQE